MKRQWAVFLILLLLWTPSLSFAADMESMQKEYNSYHIIMLIDKSGSMNWSDPDRNAIGAAKMFVDALYTGFEDKQANHVPGEITVNVMPFNSEPDTSFGNVILDSPAKASQVTEYIDHIENEGVTDLGNAVQAAVQCLAETANGMRKGRIVLFTDGYTDYADDPEKERKEAESAETLETALQVAARQGAIYGDNKYIDVIYAIGLDYEENGEHRIRPKGREEIQRIADYTQSAEDKGLVIKTDAGLTPVDKNANVKGTNYLITSSFAEIQSFYVSLFASMMESEPPVQAQKSLDQSLPDDSLSAEEPYTYFDIPPDQNSLYNIYITSESTLGDVTLWDTFGERVSGTDASIKRDSENKYVILSMRSPQEELRLGVQAPDEKFQVQIIQIAARDGLVPPADLTLWSDPASDPVTPSPAAPYLVTPDSGTENDSIQIQPLELSVAQGKKTTVSLDDAVTGAAGPLDLTGEEIVWDTDGEKSARLSKNAVKLTGGNLTVRGKKLVPETVNFVVRARDNASNQELEIPVTVEITSNPLYYLIWGWWIPLLLIALIVAIVLIVKKIREGNNSTGNSGSSTPPGGMPPSGMPPGGVPPTTTIGVSLQK